MSVWDVYENRLISHGLNKHDAFHIREERTLERQLKNSLSYHEVNIFPMEFGFNIDSEDASEGKIAQNVAIVNSDNLNEKLIYSLPREDIELGSLVVWMDNYWLVTERDPNTTLYTKAKLLQCNHLLKWINSDDEIISQWCVVEDGTKYLTGEYEDKNFVVTRGDTRVQVQLAKTKESNLLDRNSRFLIDDLDAPHKLAYQLTKPFRAGSVVGGEGTFKFILQEVTATEFDNHELGIADYYLHFPKNAVKEEAAQEGNERKVWI